MLHILTGGGTQVGLAVAFLLAAGAIVFAGIKLSRYGDALGARTGLGAGLVGLLFLASVTSLPELVVSTTATVNASLQALVAAAGPARDALFAGGADLAIGNMLGSNVFNLMLVAVMDVAQGKGAVLHHLSRKHILTASSSLGMLGIVLFGLAFGRESGYTIPVLSVGMITPTLLLAYLAIMWVQGRLAKRPEDSEEGAAGEVLPEDRLLLM